MSDGDTWDGPSTPERFALLVGVIDVLVFAYLGHLLFEAPAYGALAGGLSGLGMYLWFPYVVQGAADAGEASEGEKADRRTVDGGYGGGGGEPVRGFHRGAAGGALFPAGVLLLAWGFVSEDQLVGTLGVVALAVLGYLVLSRTLPRR